MKILQLTLLLTIVLATGCSNHIYEFANFSSKEGTREYAIEEKIGDNNIIVIPRIHEIQNGSLFVTGRCSGEYMNGDQLLYIEGELITNKLWFVLDKRKAYPQSLRYLSTNRQQWAQFCEDHNLTTNLLGPEAFRAQSSRGKVFEL